MSDAIYWLDNTDTPGCAMVKILDKKFSVEDAVVQMLTGHDLGRIEIEEVLKPSAVRRLKLRPGRRMVVSGKYLSFRKDRPLPHLAELYDYYNG